MKMNDLVSELGVTPRRIRQLVEDGVVIALAKGLFSPASVERYDEFRSGNVGPVADRIEAGAAKLDLLSRRLAKRSDRADAEAAGEALKALEADFRMSAAMRPEAERPLLRSHGEMLVTSAREALLRAAIEGMSPAEREAIAHE